MFGKKHLNINFADLNQQKKKKKKKMPAKI